MGSLPDIRRATMLTPVQFAEATAMLARTFFDHPYFVAVFSDPARRIEATRALFGAALKDGLRHGIVFLAVEKDRVAGTLVIYRPGAYPLTIARKLRLLPDLMRLAALSPAGFLRVGRTMSVLDSLRPKAPPHYYGLCMGIAPGRQIAGIGTILLQAMHDEVDRHGQPIYAETQKDHVMKWVRDYGFEVLREGIEMFPGGPRTWTLWRPARVATASQGKDGESRMGSLPDVRRVTTLTPAEFAEATAVLARAHFDHPHTSAVFPDPARRIEAARALFGAALKDGLRHGVVVIALDDRVAGVTILYPPGAYPPTIARKLRVLPDLMRVAAVSPAGLLRVARTMRVLDGLRPKEPHYYGFCIGIEPGRQSTGLGNVLSKALHDEADRHGLPVYVETQKRSVMEWVRSDGFEILHEGIEMFPGGPPTWTMWRPGRRKQSP